MLPGTQNAYKLSSSFLKFLNDQTREMFESFWYAISRVIVPITELAKTTRAAFGMAMYSQSKLVAGLNIDPLLAMPTMIDPMNSVYEFGIQRISSRDIMFAERNSYGDIIAAKVDKVTVLVVDDGLWSALYGAQEVPRSGPRCRLKPRSYFGAMESIIPGGLDNIEAIYGDMVKFKSWYIVMIDGDRKTWYDVNAMAVLEPELKKSGDQGFDEYQIIVDNRIFSEYLASGSDIKFYITTGTDYQMSNDIIGLPTLSKSTTEGISKDNISQSLAAEGRDYRFDPSTSVIEFAGDPWQMFSMKRGSKFSVFCENTETVDVAKYANYSSVGISGRTVMNTTNEEADVIGRSAWRGLMTHGDLVSYRGLLSTYYGLPMAPYSGICIGQFDSFGYSITSAPESLDGRPGWTVKSKIESMSHISGKILVEDRLYHDLVSGVFYGVIGEDLEGKTGYLYLQGRYNIVGFNAPGEIIVTEPYDSGNGRLQLQITNLQRTSMLEQYPVMIGYSRSVPGLNGWFHLTSASWNNTQGLLSLKTYQYNPDIDDVPKYHDHELPLRKVVSETSDKYIGSIAIPYPTHKFLMIANPVTGRSDRIWMDSPVFSTLNSGDNIVEGQVMFESIVTARASDIRQYQSLDIRRNSSSKLRHSNYIFELQVVDPAASFGKYTPISIQELD